MIRDFGIFDMLSTLQSLQRPTISISLTLLVLYLAINGNERAVDAAITAFALLAGALYGERAALKVPGHKEKE